MAPVVEQISLGFVGGYIDTFSFIAMSGLFTAHVTGNLIVAGAGLLHPESASVIPNLAMIPAFIVSIGAFTYLGRSRLIQRWARPMQTAGLLSIQTLILLAFEAAGAAASAAGPFPLTHWQAILPVAALGVCALSIQNALSRITRTSALPTTIMTGNLTQAAISLFSLFPLGVSDRAEVERHKAALIALSPGLAGFFAGAVVSAPLTDRLHFHAVFLACLVLIATLPFCGRAPGAS